MAALHPLGVSPSGLRRLTIRGSITIGLDKPGWSAGRAPAVHPIWMMRIGDMPVQAGMQENRRP